MSSRWGTCKSWGRGRRKRPRGSRWCRL